MAFTVTYYNIQDPPNKINKTLGTAVGSSSCSPWEPVSDLSGKIIAAYTSAVEAGNYAAITGDGRPRYCYIRDVIKRPGGQMEVTLLEDPLMTFKTEILTSDVYATRTSQSGSDYGYNMDMDDGKTPRVVYDRVTVIPDNTAGGNVRTFVGDSGYIYAQILGKALDVVHVTT